jgi:hypothetical protein
MSEDFNSYQHENVESHGHNFFFKCGLTVDKNMNATSTVIDDNNPLSDDNKELFNLNLDLEEISSTISVNR